MKIPQGMTEKQVLDIIDTVSNKLYNKFKFGYHEVSDLKQQSALFAIEGLENYDGIRPLENFLYVHIHNRLFNFKRNNYERPDRPCLKCPFFNLNKENQCDGYSDKFECEPFSVWFYRNTAKKNLMKSVNSEDFGEYNCKYDENNSEIKEIFEIIDNNLDVKYRADYIKLKNDIKIPKKKRDELAIVIKAIMEKYNIYD